MKIIENPQLADGREHLWLLDAFLYPISSAGLIHLAVFILLPQLVSFFARLLSAFLAPVLGRGTGYILAFLLVPFYIVFYSYIFYYITDCVISSSKGNKRAPDATIQETIGIGDLISKLILVLGCFGISLCAPAVYYILTRRTDLTFWLLSAAGAFFLPMSLLSGIIFDSFDALNPILIIGSISNAFFSYCGLVLFFLAITAFALFVVPRIPIWGFLLTGIKFYLLFVLTHLLGWFYWWNKDKLDWGI
ncbi:hypothetical protein ACFL1G_05030 [Planctomycetota bacterium]